MSENEIKPVAWVDLDVWIATNDAGDSFFTDYQDEDTVAVYDQSAIDRLLEKIDRLEMIESSWLEFMGKTDWVQTASEPHELGKHRADVLKDRIDRLTAELRHYQMAATAEANLADERHKEIKRLRAERDAAESQRNGYMEQHCRDSAELRAVCAERDEAQRKLSVAVANGNALVADAERYRWLRGRTFSFSHDEEGRGICASRWGEWPYDTDEGHAAVMDKAIDAARAEGGV